MKNSFVSKALLAGLGSAVALLAATASSWALAADPATFALSREHVNLVRVQGQKITDVVYDTKALEISADKARGIVFVRVRPAWLQEGASEMTSAFFNTESENFSVQFLVSAVPSQTVDLVPSAAASAYSDQSLRMALAAPLVKAETDDFVGGLKRLARVVFEGAGGQGLPGLTAAFAERAQTMTELPAPQGSVLWQGFRVRETRAVLTADMIAERLVFTRVSAKASVPDAALLAQSMQGVIAVAQEVEERASGVQTSFAVIRARASAVLGEDAFESALARLADSGAESRSQTESPDGRR